MDISGWKTIHMWKISSKERRNPAKRLYCVVEIRDTLKVRKASFTFPVLLFLQISIAVCEERRLTWGKESELSSQCHRVALVKPGTKSIPFQFLTSTLRYRILTGPKATNEHCDSSLCLASKDLDFTDTSYLVPYPGQHPKLRLQAYSYILGIQQTWDSDHLIYHSPGLLSLLPWEISVPICLYSLRL